jgi:hypothetical protein
MPAHISQAQKHVTQNESLRLLGVLVQLVFSSRSYAQKLVAAVIRRRFELA